MHMQDMTTHGYLAAKLAIAISSITQNYCSIYELSAAEPDVTVMTGSVWHWSMYTISS